MSLCSSNFEVALIVNTGTTQSLVTFIDYSGSTISFYVDPNDSYYINFCGDFPFSGENIDFQVKSSTPEIYGFINCCDESDTFNIILNDSIDTPISINDVINTELLIPSDSSNPLKEGCYKLDYTTTPISGLTGYTIPYYSVVKNFTSYTGITPCLSCVAQNPCPTECYTLYSCDGKYNNIISSLPGLSAYTNNFVNLNILTQSVSGENICFYVLYTGIKKCIDTYNLEISENPDCDCDCLCYQFNTLSDDLETSFVDCNNQFGNVYFDPFSNVRICSKIKPYFNTDLPIGYKLGGYCVNNNCPEVKIPNIQPVNECDVLTLFPLYVECVNELPTSTNSFDGSVSLIITGGTPPYVVTWDNGSISQSLTDLTFGSYTATVVDYYGDFSATTTCVLRERTTTTTTTIPVIPKPINYTNLCMFVDYTNSTINDRYIDFIFEGYYNEKPYWQSLYPLNIQIVWSNDDSFWFLSGLTSGQVVNLNPETPPLTGWQAIGFLPPFVVNEIYTYTGSCSQIPITSLEILSSDPTCGCDGSMSLVPTNGLAPYQYSINGGTSYSSIPVFTNLCSGLYPVQVLDSNGSLVTSQITLASAPSITTYVLKLVVDTINESFDILISPTLPAGVTIDFTLVHNRLFRRGPTENSATYDNNLTVYVGPPITTPTPYNLDNYSYSQENLPYPCELFDQYITESYFKWNLSMNSITTINGGYTNNFSFTSPSNCNTGSGDFGIYIDNAKINGCECCEVVTINPKFRISSSDDIIFTD